MITLYANRSYGTERVENVPFIELQWNRKYFEAGDFSLLMRAEDCTEDYIFIKVLNRPEMGIITKKLYEAKLEGNFVTLSGFFSSKALDYGVLVGDSHLDYRSGGKLIDGISTLLTSLHKPSGLSALEPMRACRIESVNGNGVLPNNGYISLKDGEFMGQALFDYCKTIGISYYCSASKRSDGELAIDVNFYKGRDLRETVHFGSRWDNVSEIQYAFDESDLRPYYIVLQKIENESDLKPDKSIQTGDGVSRYLVEYYLDKNNATKAFNNCYPAKVLYSSVSNITMDKAHESSIRRAMIEAAKLDMLNHYRIETVQAKVLPNRTIYEKDYNLGDIVSIELDELKKSFVSRIIEAREVYSANKREVDIVLGTPSKRIYNRYLI